MTVVVATIALAAPAGLAVAERAHEPVVLRLGNPRTKLEHIVFFVKENRSFDHYFGAFPDPTTSLDQATSARCAGIFGTRTFPMGQAPDPMPQDVNHGAGAWTTAYRS